MKPLILFTLITGSWMSLLASSEVYQQIPLAVTAQFKKYQKDFYLCSYNHKLNLGYTDDIKNASELMSFSIDSNGKLQKVEIVIESEYPTKKNYIQCLKKLIREKFLLPKHKNKEPIQYTHKRSYQ